MRAWSRCARSRTITWRDSSSLRSAPKPRPRSRTSSSSASRPRSANSFGAAVVAAVAQREEAPDMLAGQGEPDLDAVRADAGAPVVELLAQAATQARTHDHGLAAARALRLPSLH